MDNNELWRAVLGEFELTMTTMNFRTWFGQSALVSLENGVAVISLPNKFIREWVEKKFQQQIIKSIERISSQPIGKIEFRLASSLRAAENTSPTQIFPTTTSGTQPKSTKHSTTLGGQQTTVTDRIEAKNKFGLNPRYTFETFIVGKTNELAHAAAQAAASRPGEVYNPLFIYGGVGLGKTHLIQAIGNRMAAEKSNICILYISSERFTNDFVAAIRSGTIKQFKDTYRNVDLLLIDDIQFIAGKMETQEEFFHTFNELHQANKQIVMTSDRPPKAIPGLEDRLRSRFEWGMIADVAPPDLETRVAILEAKCLEKKYSLSKDILQTVATIIRSNIRELEGALNKIIAHHAIKSLVPTIDTIKSLLIGYEEQSFKKSLTPKDLVVVVSQYFDVSLDEIMSSSREKRLAFPRQITMYLLREELKSSFPAIGQELGGRDHTTAMHAHEKIGRELENDMKLKQDLAAIRQRLYTVSQG